MSVRISREVTACVVTIVWLLAPVSARQQQPSAALDQFISAERGLSLNQLVSAALDRSPTILAARARVTATHGERLQADLRPNPSVVSDYREQVDGTDRLIMFGLSWPLDLWTRSGRTDLGDRAIEAAERQVRDIERRLAADVRSQALRLAAAARQLAVREQVAQALAQFRDLVAARASSGAAPPVERDVADVDARRAAVEVFRARAAAEAAVAELKALVGLQPSDSLLLRDGLEQLSTSSELLPAGATNPILGNRADVRFADAQFATAAAGLKLTRLNAKPEVTLNTSYMRMNSMFPQFGLDSSGMPVPIQGVFHNVSIGAMVTLPLSNRRQGDIAAATARVTVAQHEAEAVRIAAAAEITAATSRVQRLDQGLALYADGLRDLALKNVDVMRGSYQLGRATLLDVLNETRRFLETEMAYTELLLEALQARSDLATATGVIR